MRIFLFCFLFICLYPRGLSQVSAVPAVLAEVSPVSSAMSPPPRLTAPWLTYSELAALHFDAYCQVIVDVNIFQPLRWESGVPKNPYQLIGTLVKGEAPRVAYILNTFTKRVHQVRLGERLDALTVVSVTPKSVSLRDAEGVLTTFALRSMFLNKK